MRVDVEKESVPPRLIYVGTFDGRADVCADVVRPDSRLKRCKTSLCRPCVANGTAAPKPRQLIAKLTVICANCSRSS